MNASLDIQLHEDAIVECCSISSTSLFLLRSPVMSPRIVWSIMLALAPQQARLKELRRQIGKQLLQQRSLDDSNLPSSTAATLQIHCVKEGDDSILSSYSPVGIVDGSHDDELVVHLFRCGFLLWWCYLMYQIPLVSPLPPSETEGLAKGKITFASCCGGIVRLDRPDLLLRCFTEIRAAIQKKANSSDVSSTHKCDSIGFRLSSKVISIEEEELASFSSFVSAVMERYPMEECSLVGLDLLTSLSSSQGELLAIFDVARKKRNSNENDRLVRVPVPPPDYFHAALIQLLSHDATPILLDLLIQGGISAATFYATDVEVLLSSLRLQMNREVAGNEKILRYQQAIRAILKDTIPDHPASNTEDVVRWFNRLELKRVYSDELRERSVTGRMLMNSLSFGRLDIMEKLGIWDADDIDVIYHVFNAY